MSIPGTRCIPKSAATSAAKKLHSLYFLFPQYHTQTSRHFFRGDLCAGAGLGGLEGLGTAQLGGGGGLDGLGGLADGGGAGDGVLTEVGAVVALGGGVDDGGVEPGKMLIGILLGAVCAASAAQKGQDVLARALGGAEAGLVDQLSGLVLLVGLLDEELDAAVLAGDDADGLFMNQHSRSLSCISRWSDLVGDRALVLAAVEVLEVQRVARELDAVGPLDEGGAVALGHCPGKVVGDCGGHCVGMGCVIRGY